MFGRRVPDPPVCLFVFNLNFCDDGMIVFCFCSVCYISWYGMLYYGILIVLFRGIKKEKKEEEMRGFETETMISDTQGTLEKQFLHHL